ncbi:hypothetical protein L227DRAFT_275606 [Lentinus tigrinus ALCF2SS1-6]|uniref:DUF6533 domain-containing protein n=1 Tax=Lentinus tigrinus ALCF2SS1-6 TaxID=1328759 RepID=A0A5C2SML0_9APHY|nr:hypothetical protein L227DRAFT_275606 [Lentinus tigrinus ALCF2SS1-6]
MHCLLPHIRHVIRRRLRGCRNNRVCRLSPDAYVALFSIVFFIYDYIITIGREVDLFWTRKVTGASVLFLFIRYGTLVYKILDLVSYGPMSDKLCNASASMHHDRNSPISPVCCLRWDAGLGID